MNIEKKLFGKMYKNNETAPTLTGERSEGAESVQPSEN